jgi:hypothetical protein
MRRYDSTMNRTRWLRGTVWTSTLALALGTVVSIAPAHATSGHVAGVKEFDEPTALAIGSGHLWVVNEAGNSVTEINPNSSAWIATFTRSNGYRFDKPDAATVNGADLFVANTNGSVTEMASSNGKFVRNISGAKFHFVNPVAITSSGRTLLVLNAGTTHKAGSITEINARTGALVRVISGASFAFSYPVAQTVSGGQVFVADEGNNSVTEANIANGALVRVVTGDGLSLPDGIAVASGNVWVADSASSSATDINVTTGAVVATYSDNNGDYGFGQPSAVIAAQGSVYVMTPYSDSPMVTKVDATTGVPAWYMCNTNGPYYFSLLSAFAVSGNDLWVASRSGANSATPGAATGSLTELLITSGALLATVPTPTTTPSTTTTTTTTP